VNDNSRGIDRAPSGLFSSTLPRESNLRNHLMKTKQVLRMSEKEQWTELDEITAHLQTLEEAVISELA
jgi:hypothetical protein